MLVRIVKMTFREDAVDDFIALFNESKEKIRLFPGCNHLILLQGRDADRHIFTTYSHWDNAQALEHYRQSDLFKKTWAQTKVLFNGRPEAMSFVQIAEL